MAHCNPKTQETEAGELILQGNLGYIVPGQPEQQSMMPIEK